MAGLGKLIVFTGIVLIIFGAVLMLGAKVSWLGRLPGDIYIQKKNFSLFFPITTSIIISIVISAIFILLRRR